MSVNNKQKPVSQEHLAYLKRIKQKKAAIRITQIALLVFLLALWEFAAVMKWIDPL